MTSTSTPRGASAKSSRSAKVLNVRVQGSLHLLMLVAAVAFVAMHFLHLSADFPNYSTWVDWSKYTDEGWYGDAAIRHLERGHWYVPGDFNPAAALPVWPALELLVFRFTGVSLVAARGLTVLIFACILLASYALILRWHRLTGGSQRIGLGPPIAVLLLAVSPFCYAFTRLAILEPLLILLTLASLLVASFFERDSQLGGLSRPSGREFYCVLTLGLLLPTMVLTKTTAIFLFPSILWLLFARSGFRTRPFLRRLIPIGLLSFGVWGVYFGLLVRPHYLEDYRYLFSANAYTGITLANAISVLSATVSDGLWIGHVTYPLALLCTFAALFAYGRLRANPLIPAFMLWAAGYACFLAYHDNLQPRYYLVVAVPLTLLVAVVMDGLFFSPWREHRSGPAQRFLAVVSAAVLLLLVVRDGVQTLGYVRRPEYTFLIAAKEIHQIVSSDKKHSALVLSISGSDLSLMTGLPSICDDFGTMELADRVRMYRPGWYVAWNQVDDDKMDALTPLYRLERIASFPAFDDPDRNLLILYRLDDSVPSATGQRRNHAVPRRLQTRVGQQPSVVQLEH